MSDRTIGIGWAVLGLLLLVFGAITGDFCVSLLGASDLAISGLWLRGTDK